MIIKLDYKLLRKFQTTLVHIQHSFATFPMLKLKPIVCFYLNLNYNLVLVTTIFKVAKTSL